MLTEQEVKRMFAAMDYAETQKTSRAWVEYDNAAEWCAKRKLTGKYGDPLPANLNSRTLEFINNDPEAFETRVRDTAYALAMEKHQ